MFVCPKHDVLKRQTDWFGFHFYVINHSNRKTFCIFTYFRFQCLKSIDKHTTKVGVKNMKKIILLRILS